MMKSKQLGSIIQKYEMSNPLHREIRRHLALMDGKLEKMLADAPKEPDLLNLLLSGGKRLRPTLALICAKLGEPQEDVVPLMCMLELMHTASLVHDDVVDGADMRRGRPTINTLAGNHIAVQSGDFLLAKAMEILHVYKGMGINELLAEVSLQMTLGELEQQALRYKYSAKPQKQYFDLVRRKTAFLIGASCATGAMLGGLCKDEVDALHEFGIRLGIAFQLRDDLLDYSLFTGKPAGQDLRNGILTLPIILLMEGSPPQAVTQLLRKPDKNPEDVAGLVEYVRGSDVLQLCETHIREHCSAAQSHLDIFPENDMTDALRTLANSLSEHKIKDKRW
ncbi:MAG: polyprenyl synthetase family protein [Oscillospiraceae bacterium]|nr:polyprenyl synthetase family protein [Oscillospiraceae bacterium]